MTKREWEKLSRQSRMNTKTTIQISMYTRDKLASLGKKDDSYDDILKRLLKKKAK